MAAEVVYPLAGRVVLVTGAARGIGFAIAEAAHDRGASVALVDLDAEVAAESASIVGERAIGLGADVTDGDAIRAALAAAVERFGKVDVIVANAGISPEVTTAAGIDPAEWDRVFEVNLLGAWRTVAAGMDQVVGNGGHLVLVSSSYAFLNGVLNSPYAASKAGVEALGRSLRTELMPLGAGATVAYFGWIETEMVRGAFADPIVDRMRRLLPGFLTRRIPVGTAGRAVVDAIERRQARVIVPFEYRVLFHLRGLLGPLMDSRFSRDPRVAAIVRDAESRSEEARG